MKFYLGTHMVAQHWWDRAVPLFVSRRVLTGRKKLPVAAVPWALDSGGFTELNMYGRWQTGEADYVADVLRFDREIGRLQWVAPMDWMCEPHVLAKTGHTIEQHQSFTVSNYQRLERVLGPLVVPVLQGWERDDYHRHWQMYDAAGIDLGLCPTIGLGTICRRQNMAEAGRIVRSLQPLRLHAFGVKLTGLESFGDALVSADSMAWSYAARRGFPLPGHTHKTCANCPDYAMRWYANIRNLLAQTRLEVTCAV